MALAAPTAPAAPARSRREVATLLVAVLGLLSLFVTKAFAIDDPLFLWLGKHIREHPLDFFGFEVNWYGLGMPMHDVTMNPPLAGYFIALVGSLFGFSEVALHTAFLIPAGLVCLGTYRLAQDLCGRPLLASLLGLLTPVFLVSSTSVMCDTMMLASWCWSVVWWRRGLRDGRTGLLVLAAFLAGCAGLTKYFGFALVPLLGLHGLMVRRRVGTWALPLLIPVGMAVAYELATSAMYGHGLIWGAREYAAGLRDGSQTGLLSLALSGLVFSGGCLATAILLGPLLARARWTLLALAAGFLLLVASTGPHELLGPRTAPLATNTRLLDVQVVLMMYGGVVITWLALAEVVKRDADSVLLACWVLGTLVFASFLNWVNNGRSILPMAPAVGILLARRLELRAVAAPFVRRALVPALGLAALLAAVVTWADARWADQSRLAANELAAEYGDEAPLYVQGHWGFQYYAELAGALRFDPRLHALGAGAVMVIPTNNYGIRELPPTHVTPLESREYRGLRWVHTASMGSGAFFYANNIAPLPFAIGDGLPDGYVALRVSRPFSFKVHNKTPRGEVQIFRPGDEAIQRRKKSGPVPTAAPATVPTGLSKPPRKRQGGPPAGPPLGSRPGSAALLPDP